MSERSPGIHGNIINTDTMDRMIEDAVSEGQSSDFNRQDYHDHLSDGVIQDADET